MSGNETEKRAAARAAAALVRDGQLVGLGSGSTVAHLFPALAERNLRIRCVAASPASERAARAAGLEVGPFEDLDRLDVAIDGADQITRDGWLIKGGGAAHTREKIVAAAAESFIVIGGAEKLVGALTAPVPVELLEFGLAATLAAIAPISLRDVPRSPDGGIIADYHGPLDDPARLAASLSATPGVVDHGIFTPDLTSVVIIAQGEETFSFEIPRG